MKIADVRAVLAGYRKTDPDMQRSFALVRVETDDGIVGWGEASTNWGHSYPTVFRAVVDDVCARMLLGRDPAAVRERVAELSVALDGYLGWEGVTSQVVGAIEIALWDVLGSPSALPCTSCSAAPRTPSRSTAPARPCSRPHRSGTPSTSTSAGRWASPG